MKSLLRSQLAVEPLPETEEGVRRLLAGKGVHGWPEAGPPEMAEPTAAQGNAASAQVPLKRREAT